MHLLGAEVAAGTAKFKKFQHPFALGGEAPSALMQTIFEGSVLRILC
jgi:hypothetical protein